MNIRLLILLLSTWLININTHQAFPSKNPTILNTHYQFPSQGGMESHLLIFNKIFNQHAVKHTLLTSKNSRWLVNNINDSLGKYGPLCHTYNHNELNPKPLDIIKECTLINPSIIICNWIGNLEACITASKIQRSNIIYVHHVPRNTFTKEEITELNQTKGIVTVSPLLIKDLKQMQEKKIITVKNVEHIPPFWDEDKFLSFKPTRSKATFLTKTLHLTIKDNYPIICSVANLGWYKNHKLLLQAVAQLIHKEQRKFHLILAGDGSHKDVLTKLTQELNISPYVHFVGKIDDIPELLYHANIHVLASSYEPFGLTHLEAATMKKPFIGATQTGAAEFIQHGINGFIFENNNAQDLAEKLSKLLDNPMLCKTMGENAHQFVHKNYSNNVLFNKWMMFLKSIERNDRTSRESLLKQEESITHITVAILAKQMSHVLPLYLTCIEQQTWPKDKTYLYIRTNNNKDNTVEILKQWVNKVGHLYAGIHFDDTDVKEKVENFGIHQWNKKRFKVLGKIRQDSVNWAREHNSHYFVADCDNFIRPDTIEALMMANLPVVAPLLRRNDDNNHPDRLDPDIHGPSSFYTRPADSPIFWDSTYDRLHQMLLFQKIKSLTKVPIVHCTYLVRHEILDKVLYDDDSGGWEFQIFSNNLIKQEIEQYIDTRELYGYLTRAENSNQLATWMAELKEAFWLKETMAQCT